MKHWEFKHLAQGHKPVWQEGLQSPAPNIQLLKRVNNLPLTAAYLEMVNVQLLELAVESLPYIQAHGFCDFDKSATQCDLSQHTNWDFFRCQNKQILNLSRNGERKTYAALWSRVPTFLSYISETRKGPQTTWQMTPRKTKVYNKKLGLPWQAVHAISSLTT